MTTERMPILALAENQIPGQLSQVASAGVAGKGCRCCRGGEEARQQTAAPTGDITTDTITDTIDAVATTATDTSPGARQAQQATEELARMSTALTATISHFLTSRDVGANGATADDQRFRFIPSAHSRQ